jgi:hypothetical protein
VIDWTNVASLVTAGGTLVLGVATFAAVRSANRSARSAERSFEIGVEGDEDDRSGRDWWVSVAWHRTFEVT